MAPKKAKNEALLENAWRTNIENAPLNEETWKVQVVMIESAGSDQDRIYMNKFEIFAAEEKRFVVKNICKTETIFMVNQLGGEKKVKDDNLRVFEEGQAYLKNKKDIPADILALIIKHLILKMKEEYLFIKRQKLEVKEGMRRESLTMIGKDEVRGAPKVKEPEPVLPPPPPSAKSKGKKEDVDAMSMIPEPDPGKKYNTLLRVRGEEWRDKVYVDDYPTDGPNLYVAVTGFVEPLLPGSLLKIGIPLTAVVQVKIDPNRTKVPSTLFRATKRGQSQTEILTETSYKFWEDLQAFRINKDSADDYKNTAFIEFSPPYWDSENLSGNPDKIYDELCFLMYDVQDLTRQHLHYLSNLDIIKIHEGTRDDRYEKYYHQQIDDLPLECVTIYSVLDSILQTVCKSHELDESSSRTSLSTAVTLNKPVKSGLLDDEKTEKAESFMKEVFNTLCKTEANKKMYRVTYGEEYEDHKPPVVINYGDFAKYSTFHLGNIDLDNIVWSSLYGLPLHKLWDTQSRPTGELEAKINFHVNVLLTCFQREDVETAELNRLVHILACRKLFNNRSSLKKKQLPPSTIAEFKKVFLKRTLVAEPLSRSSSVLHSFGSGTASFPSITKSEDANILSDQPSIEDPETQRIKFLFDCPDISELVSAAEIANGSALNHLIDDFDYFEDFSGVSAFQIMLDAFNKFNCVDYKYCEVTDCFVLMFFNSHDKNGIAREEWRCHLSTPVCLQDFFDFVLEENYDWVQNEENLYDEAMQLKSQSEYKVIVDPNAIKSCVGDSDVAIDLLMEGSLKFQDLAEVEQPQSPTASNSGVPSVKSPVSTSTKDDDKNSKSSKKTKTTTGTPKSLRQSFMTGGTLSESIGEIPPKPFYGYDLGDRRVEVFGKDGTYFSRDGTRVQSSYTLIIPHNIEYIVMNVVPGNSCNEFWLHRALGITTPEIMDSCESFRITSKDHVMMNIKKQSYQVPLPLTSVNAESPPQVFSETKTYHSLFVTWPNGLITESVYTPNSPIISHIKQYYITSTPNLDEDMRCINLNGEVIIFKKSGDIDVLKPDSSLVRITKYRKELIVPEVPDDAQTSDISSDKSKKSKGKDKPKPSKSSSKGKSDDSEIKEDEKPPEYEIIVEEYELIETSGLRQKWVNDYPFTIEKLLILTATDFCLGEVFSRRMDGTHILLNKDGVQIVTFPNKTRIITKYIIEEEEIFPEWTEDEIEYLELCGINTHDTDTIKSKVSISQKSYLTSQGSATSSNKRVEIKEVEVEEAEEEIKVKERQDGYVSVQIIYIVEHANFTTVTIDKSNDKITVESPNNTSVAISSENMYNIHLDSATTASFNSEHLYIKYEACPECQAFTTFDIKIKPDELSSVTKFHQNWLKMKDSFSKRVVVNEEGNVNLVEEYSPEETLHSEDRSIVDETVENVEERQAPKSENSIISHGKCREMYLAKTLRFFILQRDLACAELVHRALLDQYKRDCRWQPWCSINQYDTFGDNRSLLSILTPVHLNESEKWLMDSKLADKPKYLTYKDLKKDCGKGFYHWMRPYERFEPKPMKPDNVLPPRLPRAYILRTLEQQWKESSREMFKGAKELLNAILQYRTAMESDSEALLHVPLVDLRSDDERRVDDVIQALAHRIYEDLKERLEADVQSRAKATITTKPAAEPELEEMSVEGELEEGVSEYSITEEESLSRIKQVEEAVEMSPNLKRYWRRRAEEYKEEQFYQYLLREGSVPPYFRNVLGGAIWWEMNNTTDEAVTKAERRKMKCNCEEASQNPDSDIAPFM